MKNKIILAFFIAFAQLSYAQTKTPIPSKSITIVALGDSLTEGLGVAPQAAYPALLETALRKKHPGIKIVNAGVSGATSASGPSRMRFLAKTKPQWVILALGANDGLRGLAPEQMEKNLKETIKLAKDVGAKVLLAGMKSPPNLGQAYSKKFDAVFAGLAKDKSIVYLPFLLDRVAGERKYNQPDGLHPNEEGHKIMAEQMQKVLEKHL